MRKAALMILLVGVALIFSAGVMAQQQQPHKDHATQTVIQPNEQAVVTFADLVRVNGALLKGEYVLIHDWQKKASGEECFFIYTSNKGQPGRLVAAFHCESVERKRAEKLNVEFVRAGVYIVPEIREIQFAGSTIAHKVLS